MIPSKIEDSQNSTSCSFEISFDERKNGYAYVLKDKISCYIIVRDDEKMLPYYDEENHFKEADKGFKKLFQIESYPKIREISLPNFEAIMANKTPQIMFVLF